jgi:hypothetical protein
MLALTLILVPSPSHGQSTLTVPRFEEGAVSEMEVPLPEYPRAGSLLEFPTQWTVNTILVDGNTLVLAGDGVARFTLVVRSPSGAESVSFEGIRCTTGERRVFAFGRKTADGGTWSQARGSAWRPISDSRINRQYFEFWRDVFCDGSLLETRVEILKNLRRGGRERQQGSPGD